MEAANSKYEDLIAINISKNKTTNLTYIRSFYNLFAFLSLTLILFPNLLKHTGPTFYS